MKLLTPSQTKDLKDQQIMRGIIRTQELDKAENEARRNLANAEADFFATLARHREQWALEEEAHHQRVIEQQAELAALEVQKLNALIPFKILKDGTLERLGDAEAYLKQLQDREERNDDLAELLEDKLDATGVKEQDLLKWEQKLVIQQDNVDRQTKATTTAANLLSEQVAEFMAYKISEQKGMASTLLSLQEREQTISITEVNLSDKAIELLEQAARLADERTVLARAWDELERRKVS